MLLERVGSGAVAGADISAEMVGRAWKRFAADVAAGRLALACAPADDLPFPDADFASVVAIQTIYFWPDRQAGLNEGRRVLRPGGRLALGLSPRIVQEALVARSETLGIFAEEQAAEALAGAGFEEITPTAFTTEREGGGGGAVVATSPAPLIAEPVARTSR